MKLLSSEARSSAAAAISSDSPRRPSGVCATSPAVSAACWPELASALSRPGVAVGPGDITLTRMPEALRSSAQLLARLRTAALVALHAEGGCSHGGGGRAGEDDRSASLHQRQGLLNGEQGASDIHAKNPIKGFWGDSPQWLKITHSRVGEEYVDAALGGFYRGEDAVQVFQD